MQPIDPITTPLLQYTLPGSSVRLFCFLLDAPSSSRLRCFLFRCTEQLLLRLISFVSSVYFNTASQRNVFPSRDRLVGLVVKAPGSRAKDPGFESRCVGIFPGSSHTSDLKTGTSVATLPGAWRYRASAGTGWPGVSNCDWVRWKVWSATFISVRQQIRP